MSEIYYYEPPTALSSPMTWKIAAVHGSLFGTSSASEYQLMVRLHTLSPSLTLSLRSTRTGRRYSDTLGLPLNGQALSLWLKMASMTISSLREPESFSIMASTLCLLLISLTKIDQRISA